MIGGGDELYVVDASDPSAPSLLETVALEGASQSVDVNSDGLVAVAVGLAGTNAAGVSYHAAGKVQLFEQVDSAMVSRASLTVGALPDSLAFSPDGTQIVTADEGEPNTYYGQGPVSGNDISSDPVGTISIIDVDTTDYTASVVTTLGFDAFDQADLEADGVRITGDDSMDGIQGNLVQQDMEPEYVAIEGTTAYVSAQENNAIIEVDLTTKTITSVKSAGLKDWDVEDLVVDTSDKDGGISPGTRAFKGVRMPDGIATYVVGDETYVVMANEGDGRVRPDEVNLEISTATHLGGEEEAWVAIVAATPAEVLETVADPISGTDISVVAATVELDSCTSTQIAATCVEAVEASVDADAAACAAVTALSDSSACDLVMTEADDSVTACTYTAANAETTMDEDNCEITSSTDFGTTEGSCAPTSDNTGTHTCAYVPGSWAVTEGTAVDYKKCEDGDEFFITAQYGFQADDAFYSDEERLYKYDDLSSLSTWMQTNGASKSSLIGRLKTVSTETDTNDDDNPDEVVGFGGRSFSIMKASDGEIVYDSGDSTEQQAIAAGIYDDGRSDDKGTEPEGVTLATIDGKTFAFIALERVDAVAVYDITSPTAVAEIRLINVNAAGGGEGPECVVTSTADDLVIVASEDGTTGLAFYSLSAAVVPDEEPPPGKTAGAIPVAESLLAMTLSAIVVAAADLLM